MKFWGGDMRGEVADDPSLVHVLRRDLERTYVLTRGPRAKRLLDCLRTPGVHAVIAYRLGNRLQHVGGVEKLAIYPVHLWLNRRSKVKWGIEISKSATIGAGLYVAHFGGITIAPSAVIGENCTVSQQVVIGVSGQGENEGAPVIGDKVYLAPGAKLFGKIVVGGNTKIGANAVIHKDVPAHSIVVMDPGFRILPQPS